MLGAAAGVHHGPRIHHAAHLNDAAGSRSRGPPEEEALRKHTANAPGTLRSALLAATLLGTGLAGPAWAAKCEAFAGAALPGDGRVTAAERVPAGAYTAPNGQTFQNLPAFCRVVATLRPSPDSDITMQAIK